VLLHCFRRELAAPSTARAIGRVWRLVGWILSFFSRLWAQLLRGQDVTKSESKLYLSDLADIALATVQVNSQRLGDRLRAQPPVTSHVL